MTAPFGALAPSPFEEAVRRAARGLSNTAIGKRAASLLLRAAGGKSGRAFDVPVFGTERARLHPYDNISEKRVYITPQFWEGEERAALAKFIASGSGDFRFLDVGANAGLYTLFARSEARASGRPFQAICIEPAPEMLARLRFNLEASGAASEARVVACAVGARSGAAAFSVNERNRGESRIAARGGLEVEVRTLASIIDEAGAPRIDAMKIDIEGGETAALDGLFAAAGERFRPAFIIMEMSHSDSRATAMLAAESYREILRTGRNGVFARV
ncbi:MAG: FkbM family methyltransferase [Parvularculaceae bacterium]